MRKMAFILSMWLVSATNVTASQWSDCIADKYKRYAVAQAAWQTGLNRLILEVAPQYADVAQLYMTDQLRAIERARLAVEYLTEHDPTKLRTQLPLPNWLNLDEADVQRIANDNRRYAELLRLEKEAMARPPHPDGDDLRRFMRTEINALEGYRKLLDAFSRSVQDAGSIECK